MKLESQRVWDAILEHPFVKELGAGTLPIDKFTYYIKQDYQYLIEFTRCIGIAAYEAEDVETMRKWASMMDRCLRYEPNSLQRHLKRELYTARDDHQRHPHLHAGAAGHLEPGTMSQKPPFFSFLALKTGVQPV